MYYVKKYLYHENLAYFVVFLANIIIHFSLLFYKFQLYYIIIKYNLEAVKWALRASIYKTLAKNHYPFRIVDEGLLTTLEFSVSFLKDNANVYQGYAAILSLWSDI